MGYVPNVGYLDFKKDNKRTLAETHGNYSMEHMNGIQYSMILSKKFSLSVKNFNSKKFDHRECLQAHF